VVVEVAMVAEDAGVPPGDPAVGHAVPTASPTLPPGGHGLIGLRERALLLGGTFHAQASEPGGFVLRATFPTGQAPRAAQAEREPSGQAAAQQA
jgi:hypothetical protein